jgi:hypothetical protein
MLTAETALGALPGLGASVVEPAHRVGEAGHERRAWASVVDRDYRRVGSCGVCVLAGQTGSDLGGDGEHLSLLLELRSAYDTI